MWGCGLCAEREREGARLTRQVGVGVWPVCGESEGGARLTQQVGVGVWPVCGESEGGGQTDPAGGCGGVEQVGVGAACVRRERGRGQTDPAGGCGGVACVRRERGRGQTYPAGGCGCGLVCVFVYSMSRVVFSFCEPQVNSHFMSTLVPRI